MKKRILLFVSLLVAMSLFSGCSMIGRFAFAPIPNAQTRTAVEETEFAEPAYELEDSLYAGAALSYPNTMYPAASMPQMNTEEYASVAENGFRAVTTSPLSTFSADVDTASYCNLRRMLNDSRTTASIPSGAVRVEEMLNYFRYGYAAPEGGARFGVTATIADCPWNPAHELLMAGVRAADAPDIADEGSNLVFLVDVSGSMSSPDKLDLAKQALIMLADSLTEKDTVSIVTYASGERIVIEGANPARDKVQLLSAIDALSASGSTAGERGLRQAYEVAQRYLRPRGNNRVILCSDGDLNVGITSQSDLHDFVTEKKETGVYLSVLGFGEGNYKDTKMETLADDGNGNYYYIDSILEARKVLCEELTQTLFTIADDVKFQIEFNPAKVASYRQIGYENRALENADFTDDTKDAGEVGAGASVTVMYELIPAGAEEVQSGLRYQNSALTEAAAGDEWLTLSVRYKEPGGDESKLLTFPVGEASITDAPDGDFLFASAVAEFGMLLGGSEFAGTTSFSTVLDLLKQAPLSDPYREEFFSLVKIAERNDALSR